MGVNQNNGGNNAWEDNGDNGRSNDNRNTQSSGLTSLLGLLGQTSSTFTGRAIPEMNKVQEELQKVFKQRGEDRLNTLKAKIVPGIDLIDPNVSPILPGLVLWLKQENTIYIAPFLFYAKNMIVDVEEVVMYTAQASHRVNVPRTPSAYIDKRLNHELVNTFKTNHGSSLNIVQIAAGVINLELYGDIRNDEKRVVDKIQAYMDREWETGILIELVRQTANTPNAKLPSPFFGNQPYGANGTADARIAAITTPVHGENGVILPANMEVAVVTTNPNQYGQNNPNSDSTPREVCRVHANVSLLPVNHGEYLTNIRRANINPLGLGGPMNDGYRPFRPCIALNNAIAGPQMNSNGGIIPFLMGLYVLMCANNRYAFADVLRRPKCGVRGNLANLEPRLDKLFQDNHIPRIVGQNSTKLDSKTIIDIELVNRWIQQHIMQQAIFTVPVLPTGANSALTKLLIDLNNPTTRADAVKAIMSAADAISNNAFSKAAAANSGTEGKGWNPSKPIYHASNILVVDGTARFNGELFNLGELDEMSVHHFAGPNGGANADVFLRTMYQQNDRENLKARQQRLRIMLTEAMNLTDLEINGFGRVAVMDPGFMNLLGTVFSSIGTLNTSSISGNFMNNEAIFAPGTSLAVDYVAGVNTNQQGGASWDAYGVI